MDKRENQISEMEDLIAQLNADKNYFEKELIEMQVKQNDMIEEMKQKDKEIFKLQNRYEGVDLDVEAHLARIRDLESGRVLRWFGYFDCCDSKFM